MPSPLTSGLVDEKNKIHNLSPWIWLFEIRLDETEAVRLAGYTEDVVSSSETFSAFPIVVGSQTRDREGVLQEVEVVVSNFQNFVTGYLEAGKILDQEAVLRLVHGDHLNDAAFTGTFTVREATATKDAVSFLVSLYSVMDAPLPAQLFTRGRCRFLPRYGGPGCEYDTALANKISGTNPDFNPAACDGTLDGANGCRVHGDNEVANGRPRLHPQLYGAFPGTPKGPARV